MSKIEINKPLFLCLLVLLFLILNPFQKLQAQQLKSYYLKELCLESMPVDSVPMALYRLRQKACHQLDTVTLIKSLIAGSAHHRLQLNIKEAADQAEDAVYISNQFGDVLLQARAYEMQGVLQLVLQQYDGAKVFLDQSYRFYKRAEQEKVIFKQDLFHTYYYQALVHQHQKQWKKAEAYLDSCSTILRHTMLDPVNEVYVNKERVHFLQKDNRYQEAESLLLGSIEKLEVIPLTTSPQSHRDFLMVLYQTLAHHYELERKKSEAESYFEKALKYAENCKGGTFHIATVYDSYAQFWVSRGEYKKANQYVRKAQELHRLVLNRPQNSRNESFGLKAHYRTVLTAQSDELAKTNRELLEKEEMFLYLKIVSILLLLICFSLVFLLFLSRNNRTQFKGVNTLEESQDDSKDLLEHKNKELTSSMLHLIEKEEMIIRIQESLKENKDPKKTLKMIESAQKQSAGLWDSFNSRFMEQNHDFYDRLREIAPELNSTDLKISALIKLNFNGKEMAYLLGISLGSVHVARHRLRKKLKIERDVNLSSFIQRL